MSKNEVNLMGRGHLEPFGFRRALLALLVIVVSGSLLTVFGQATTTRLSGSVKDPSGAVVTGATVTLTDLATNRVVNVTTNDEGFYQIQDVRPGTYTVTVDATGFKRSIVENVEANVDQPATVNVTLEIGAQT